MTTNDKVKWVAGSLMLAGAFAVGVGVGVGANGQTWKPPQGKDRAEVESPATKTTGKGTARQESRPTSNSGTPSIPTKIDGLMPQFRVQSNSPTDFRVAFKAWNATEWAVLEPPFGTHAEAEAVMARSQDRLKERVEIWRPLYEK